MQRGGLVAFQVGRRLVSHQPCFGVLRRAADRILPGQATVWPAQSDGCGDCVARPKRLAMGVGCVVNDSSDSPRPSYLRACHPCHPCHPVVRQNASDGEKHRTDEPRNQILAISEKCQNSHEFRDDSLWKLRYHFAISLGSTCQGSEWSRIQDRKSR